MHVIIKLISNFFFMIVSRKICADDLRHSQQFFSNVGTISSCLPGLNQY